MQRRLKELGINVKSRPVELGYELRCCRPVAYDLTYCTILGMGVKKLYDDGKKGCIVSINRNAEVVPLYLNDIEDPETKKIPPRLVDMTTEFAKLVLSDLHVLTPRDYDKARAYLSNPEAYDFYKILNWEFKAADLLRPA